MFPTSSRGSAWLGLVFTACATAQPAAPSRTSAAVSPPSLPAVALSPATLEVRDLNLGLGGRLKSSLRLVGHPDAAWASDRRNVWALASTGEGRSAPFLELEDELWDPSGLVSTGTGWAVAAGRSLSFYEGGQLRRSCDPGGMVGSLSAAGSGVVIIQRDRAPAVVARDAQCLERWASSAIRSVVHTSGEWVVGVNPEGDTLVRLAAANGAERGTLKLSGRVISPGYVVGEALYLVTQEGDGRGEGTSATFLERVELPAWRVAAQPLGAQPIGLSADHQVRAMDEGVMAVATPRGALTVFAVSSAGARALVVPEAKSSRSSGFIARVGPRLVVASQSRLFFFDAAAGRLEGSVELTRPILELGSVEGELLAVTENALFRLRGSTSPPRPAANVAWLRARPFQPGAVAALTDGVAGTGFDFVDEAVLELTFTRPVVLQRLALSFQNDRPDLRARVKGLRFCAREARAECWSSELPADGAPLIASPTLTQGVVLELSCTVPAGVLPEASQRCRVTELQFE